MAENQNKTPETQQKSFIQEILNIGPFWKAQMTDWKSPLSELLWSVSATKQYFLIFRCIS